MKGLPSTVVSSDLEMLISSAWARTESVNKKEVGLASYLFKLASRKGGRVQMMEGESVSSLEWDLPWVTL